MKKFSVAVIIALGLACLVNIPVSRAQENANEDKFSFGKVVSVAGQQISVKEYDFAKDADVEVAYQVTAETELGNINAVTDLAANDDVVIDYMEKDGKRIITTLVKEDKGAEAPEPAVAAPEAGAAAAPAPAAAVATPEAAAAPAAEAAPAVNAEAVQK